MEKFNSVLLLQYKGNNPYINRIKNKYKGLLLNSVPTMEYKLFYETLSSIKNIKFIIINPANFNIFNQRKDQFNADMKKANKKTIFISFIFDSEVERNHFKVIKEKTEINVNENENEYLLRNFRYSGYTFPNCLDLPINLNNSIYLKEQFNITDDRILTSVKIDKILGETLKTYHVLYGKRDFFLYKEDTINPVFHHWDNYPLDLDRLNSLDKSEAWVNNQYTYQKHQVLGIKAALTEKRFLIADETGIGKSKQALGVYLMSGAKKLLIVTFTDDREKWAQLICDHELIPEIINADSKVVNEDADCYIIHYHIIDKFYEKNKVFNIKDAGINFVIYDECHNLKTTTSGKTKIAKKISGMKSVEYVIGLSATPFEDNMHTFSILDALSLNKGLDKSFSYEDNIRTHQVIYCGAITGTKNINTTVNGELVVRKVNTLFNVLKNEEGISISFQNSTELGQRIKYSLLCRTEDDVIGFPEQKINILNVELTDVQKSQYDLYKKELLEHYESNENVTNKELPASIKLRQFLALINIDNTVNLAKNKIKRGEKVIIFTHFEEEINMLCERLVGDAVWVNTLKSKRWKKKNSNYEVVNFFKTSTQYNILIGNILTLGAGHNIKEADHVMLNSPDWSYALHIQGMGRNRRLDRDKFVTAWFWRYSDTEVEKVFKKAESKKENMENLLHVDRYLLKKSENEN